jgi:hypothetical protein
MTNFQDFIYIFFQPNCKIILNFTKTQSFIGSVLAVSYPVTPHRILNTFAIGVTRKLKANNH